MDGYYFYCGMCGGKAHDPYACWPWIDQAERQRRYNLPQFKERMKLHNITEADLSGLQQPLGRPILEKVE